MSFFSPLATLIATAPDEDLSFRYDVERILADYSQGAYDPAGKKREMADKLRKAAELTSSSKTKQKALELAIRVARE